MTFRFCWTHTLHVLVFNLLLAGNGHGTVPPSYSPKDCHMLQAALTVTYLRVPRVGRVIFVVAGYSHSANVPLQADVVPDAVPDCLRAQARASDLQATVLVALLPNQLLNRACLLPCDSHCVNAGMTCRRQSWKSSGYALKGHLSASLLQHIPEAAALHKNAQTFQRHYFPQVLAPTLSDMHLPGDAVLRQSADTQPTPVTAATPGTPKPRMQRGPRLASLGSVVACCSTCFLTSATVTAVLNFKRAARQCDR